MICSMSSKKQTLTTRRYCDSCGLRSVSTTVSISHHRNRKAQTLRDTAVSYNRAVRLQKRRV